MERRSQKMLILVLALLLAVPPLALGRSGGAQAQAAGDTWAAGANMPTGRWALALAAASNGKLYAVGGSFGGPGIGTVEEYDPATNTWATRASMPTGRGYLALAAASNGKLYAVGGTTGGPGLSTVEEYDPATNTWATRAPMPTARSGLGLAAASNGKLYAVGGDRGGGGGLTTVEEYDPASNTWATRAPMPTVRANLGLAAASNGRLYAVGGFNGAAVRFVEEYDPATNTWAGRAGMSTARQDLGLAAASNGKLYAVGGTNNIVQNSVEAYTPIDFPVLPTATPTATATATATPNATATATPTATPTITLTPTPTPTPTITLTPTPTPTSTTTLTPTTTPTSTTTLTPTITPTSTTTLTPTITPTPGPYGSVVLADSPVGYWPLNETAGTVASNRIAGSPNGTYGSGVTLGVPGALVESGDTAVALDGTANGLLTVPSVAGFVPASGVTVEVWVKLASYGSNARVVSKSGSYELTVLATGVLQWSLNTPGASNTATSAPAALQLGRWYYLVATYDGTTARIYVNGVEQASQVVSGPLFANNNPLTVSRPGFALTASVDEVALYAGALSPTRIAAHYSAGTPPQAATPTPPVLTGYAGAVATDNPVGYWRLNEASGTVASNSRGPAPNGSYGSGVTLGTAGALSGAANLPNSAVTLDGTANGVVTIPSVPALVPASGVTVEAWLNLTAGFPDNGRLVSKAGSYELSVHSNGTLQWSLVTSGPASVYTSYGDRLFAGRWYYLVATYDGTTARIYVDGTEKGTVPVSGPLFANNNALAIGRTTNPLLGAVDDVAVYAAALSPARITTHYTLGRPLPAANTYAGAVTADSPLGYWRLNEPSGTVATNSFGSAADGAYGSGVSLGAAGALTSAVNLPNTAAALNGTATGVVTVLSSPALMPASGVTVELWVNPASFGPSSRIVSKPGSYELIVLPTGVVQWSLPGTSAPDLYLLAADARPVGQWAHVVGTYDGTTARLYVNGVEKRSQATTGSLVNTSNPLSFSRADRPFAATLDEVAIYAGALPATRVSAHYAAR